jgi:protein-disulfide isomerase
MQPLSCTAAFAAEAARMQGRFLEFHDAVFSVFPDASEEALTEIART